MFPCSSLTSLTLLPPPRPATPLLQVSAVKLPIPLVQTADDPSVMHVVFSARPANGSRVLLNMEDLVAKCKWVVAPVTRASFILAVRV